MAATTLARPVPPPARARWGWGWAQSRRVAPGLALGLGALACLAGPSAQAALLVAAVAAGLPHGALDHEVARRVFAPRWGARWAWPFLGGYLALLAGTLALWRAAPGAALLGFLFLSALHFGEEDAGGDGAPGWPARLAHGGLPIIAPALARPDEVRSIFALLAGDAAGPVLDLLRGPAAAGWLVAAALSFRSGRGRGARAGELAALFLLFAAAPPLAAFAIYFAVIHSPRAVAALDSRARLGARVLPLTVAGLGLGALIWRWWPGEEAGGAVRACFLLLAALTVPHMWLAWLDGRRSGAGRREVEASWFTPSRSP